MAKALQAAEWRVRREGEENGGSRTCVNCRHFFSFLVSTLRARAARAAVASTMAERTGHTRSRSNSRVRAPSWGGRLGA